ncbi:helix-turn-helix domain-containing protein [Saccharospirillum mangrovi]|uniref:helix-turn-helix domain-containing protein n=1 Tax=Saccharospirillum mangrovi TaxID=2161747 RepID=UPI000D35FB6D|nr:helix-turn-helix transcriptional regulator [Saccharospirillum mangrovi]
MLHTALLIKLADAKSMLAQMAESSLSVEQVADAIGMSPYYFIRLFKTVFGVTPNQYQIQERLKVAKQRLMETDHSVTDICLDVGYSSLGTFSDLFARRFGMTPTEYRQTYRPLVKASGEVPKQWVPSCFALMCGQPKQQRNFEEA